MREYLVESLVLDKVPSSEVDLSVDLYTKELGRIKAKITSGRKIVSKLSPHLEPLTFSLVRLAEKNGFVVVDALTQDYLNNFRGFPIFFAKAIKLLSAIKELVYSEEADFKLWFWLEKSLLKKEIFYSQFLKILGYDPKLAECQRCRSRFIKYFLVKDQIFLCRHCHFEIKDFVQALEL